MADAKENRKLATDTAESLLNAIKNAADNTTGRSDTMKALAEAYATVVEAMPAPPKTASAPKRLH